MTPLLQTSKYDIFIYIRLKIPADFISFIFHFFWNSEIMNTMKKNICAKIYTFVVRTIPLSDIHVVFDSGSLLIWSYYTLPKCFSVIYKIKYTLSSVCESVRCVSFGIELGLWFAGHGADEREKDATRHSFTTKVYRLTMRRTNPMWPSITSNEVSLLKRSNVAKYNMERGESDKVISSVRCCQV